jgi:hypothetical protein
MDEILTRLKEEDGDLTQIEIDKVLRFMSHKGAEVTANNTVPCRVVLLVELLLDVSSNVLLNACKNEQSGIKRK